MRRKKIGVMDFHGSVDITDPCYDRDTWCRMNDVKIKEGDYTCVVWHHTDKGNYDGKPYLLQAGWHHRDLSKWGDPGSKSYERNREYWRGCRACRVLLQQA